MDTIVIEILRNGQSINQLLSKNLSYIALCGQAPAKDFTITCDQDLFDDKTQLLRYNTDTDETSRQLGITFFQQLISDIINQIYPAEIGYSGSPDQMVHLRLVTTPKEIAQLPFEMALTPINLQDRNPRLPFFLNPEIKTTFTREVRQVSFKHYAWPFKPRILFAWAQPNNTVPWQDHFSAFIKILRPWALPLRNSTEPVPDLGFLITKLDNATLASLKAAVLKAIGENRPYTHVHLLAHGTKNPSSAGEQFLLVLNNNNPLEGKSFCANGNDLSAALSYTVDGKTISPQIVSLIACDSGNTGNPIKSAGSIAHSLHQNGISCVFASQFPLTQDGSVKMVESLYSRLLRSSDPRLALYETRFALEGKNIHDWASLVAYARFPENIDEQMKDLRLKIMLEFMKTSNGLADHVIKNIDCIDKEKIDGFLDEVEMRLDSAINDLVSFIEAPKNYLNNKERYAEHFGLIGSAYKRKAEFEFRKAILKKEDLSSPVLITIIKDALDWYYKGFKGHPNSHWNGTQYLSLNALLNENISTEENNDFWTLCKIMATNDQQTALANNDMECLAWAYGSLMELYLLKPFIVHQNPQEDDKDAALAEAKKCLQLLNAIDGQFFPKESSARQLERYINWWATILKSTRVNELSAMAIELRKELPALEILCQ